MIDKLLIDFMKWFSETMDPNNALFFKRPIFVKVKELLEEAYMAGRKGTGYVKFKLITTNIHDCRRIEIMDFIVNREADNMTYSLSQEAVRDLISKLETALEEKRK